MRGQNVLTIILSVCTVLGAYFSAVPIYSDHPRLATTIFIAAAAIVVLVVLLYRQVRKVFIVRGYNPTIDFLKRIVTRAEKTVWTVRTHLGESSVEDDFFQVLNSRVMDKERPLEDVRRNICLRNVDSTRQHLHWLVDKFADESAVKVRYFIGKGPKYDFIIVDGDLAVIGLPRAGAHGVEASIVIRDRQAVRCIESAFDELWDKSERLFDGKEGSSLEEKTQLKKIIDEQITKCPAYP